MTRSIDGTGVINSLRLKQQASHFVDDPSAGYSRLYILSGSAHGGLYLELDNGSLIGPFVTGSSGVGRELIGSQTISVTGSSKTITFLNVPQTYNSLEIEVFGRATRVGSPSDSVYLFFNNDTTQTNYRYTFDGARAAGTADMSGGAEARIGVLAAASAGANSPGGFSAIVPSYTNPWFNKVAYSIGGYRTDDSSAFGFVKTGAIEWVSVAPITRVDIQSAVDSFATGTSVRLYGVY